MHPKWPWRVCHSMERLLTRCLSLLLLAVCCVPPSSAQTHAENKRSGLSGPTLVGYFPQWALYDDEPYLVKDLISPARKPPLVDQINYAQGFVTNGRCSVADPN